MVGTIAEALGVENVEIPEVTERIESGPLSSGVRVCFTGEAVVDGQKINRNALEARATQIGLTPVSSVTKKGCDLVVAADISSMSEKAKKARKYGKPVMSLEAFVVRAWVRSPRAEVARPGPRCDWGCVSDSNARPA